MVQMWASRLHRIVLQLQKAPANYRTNITATKNRPNKEDAIIMDSIEGLTNDDYIDGLAYLANKDLVQK